jgi:hypothetical protein
MARGALLLALLLSACPTPAPHPPAPPLGPPGLEVVVALDPATVTVRRDVALAAGSSQLRFPELPAPSTAAVLLRVPGDRGVTLSALVSAEPAELTVAAAAPTAGRRRLEITYETAEVSWRETRALTFDGDQTEAPATLERRAIVDSRGPALLGAHLVLVGDDELGPVTVPGPVDLPAAGQLIVDLAPPASISAFFGEVLEFANPQGDAPGPFLASDDLDRPAARLTSIVLGEERISGTVEIRRRDAGGFAVLGEGEFVDGRLAVDSSDVGSLPATRRVLSGRVDYDHREMLETVAIDVRGGTAATILVADAMYRTRTWEIVDSNLPYRRAGPGHVHFTVTVPSPTHPTLTYTVRYKW